MSGKGTGAGYRTTQEGSSESFGGVIQLEGISSWEVRDRWRRDSTVWSGSTGREEEKKGRMDAGEHKTDDKL